MASISDYEDGQGHMNNHGKPVPINPYYVKRVFTPDPENPWTGRMTAVTRRNAFPAWFDNRQADLSMHEYALLLNELHDLQAKRPAFIDAEVEGKTTVRVNHYSYRVAPKIATLIWDLMTSRKKAQALALDEFAEFIGNPVERGLDSYTLANVYAEARAKAAELREA